MKPWLCVAIVLVAVLCCDSAEAIRFYLGGEEATKQVNFWPYIIGGVLILVLLVVIVIRDLRKQIRKYG